MCWEGVPSVWVAEVYWKGCVVLTGAGADHSVGIVVLAVSAALTLTLPPTA